MDSSSDVFTSFSDESTPTRILNHTRSSDAFSRAETDESAYPSSLSSAPDSSISDTESTATGGTSTQEEHDEVPMFGSGLVRVTEIFQLFDNIRHGFLSGWGLDPVIEVVAIRRNVYLGALCQARVRSFQLYKTAVEQKNDGDPNVRYGWIGCRKSEVSEIVRYGFGSTGNNGWYGHGLYFSPFQASIGSLGNDLGPDEEGLRHVLLCRILLGRVEVARFGADQRCRSSQEFDSGVDNLVHPNKYIVWSCNMNTHILPHFVVSFRAQLRLREILSSQITMPTSRWVSLAQLMEALTHHPSPTCVNFMRATHRAFQAGRMSRFGMIQRIRRLAGDRLLVDILASSNSRAQGGHDGGEVDLSTRLNSLTRRFNAQLDQASTSSQDPQLRHWASRQDRGSTSSQQNRHPAIDNDRNNGQ